MHLRSSAPLAFLLLSAPGLAQIKLAQFNGQLPQESAGDALAGIGDVDGDGLADLVVGAPFHPNNTIEPGRAYVRRGLDAAPIHMLVGNFGGDDFGFAVADAGDVDGDGVHDVLVGAPDFAGGGGHDFPGTAGYVEIFSGATGAELLHVDGDLPFDMFGVSVAGLGDLDGDGTPDFAVGAHGFDGGGTNRGLVRTHSGATGDALWSIVGPTQADSSFGVRVARLGDGDGDGVDELLVGAPNQNGAFVDSGVVYVYSGASGALLQSWTGPGTKIDFGNALADVGDVDGDGSADVAIGAMNQPYPTSNGSVYVYSVASGALLWQRTSPVNGGMFGGALAAIGDVDGDGIRELVVGAQTYRYSSATYDGLISVLSGANGAELGRAIGNASDYLGRSVASLGDVDADGRADFAAGGVGANGGQHGFARVFEANAPMSPSTYCVGKTNSQGCVPALDSTGSTSFSGPDDFTVHAGNVINQKFGLFLWNAAPLWTPFQGGVLCVAAPQTRTGVVASGGSSSGADCTGVLSYTFTHTYMQSKGLGAGSIFHVQAWYRDTALAVNKVGLSNAALVLLAP
ncbi:MAG: integrin alpha [Planctomycetes bacterium]|nr:integrin alpha [Planctomycetota bacterium]